MILVIDNYDSFTFNIVQAMEALGEEVKVFRNDRITLEEIESINPAGIVVSPGPSVPENAGISVEVIRHFEDSHPILGVCLGHQCIAYAHGATIGSARAIMHGKCSPVFHNGSGLFAAVANPFTATRYHSLAVRKETIPDEFEICAWTGDNEVMGIRHREKPLFGVQFHPESVMTEFGTRIIENFLSLVHGKKTARRCFVSLKEPISLLVSGKSLDGDEMADSMNMIMSGEATGSQIGAFLTALAVKGETPEEIASAVRIMREKAIPITPRREDVLDTCGTGGDRSGSFNVSTTVAFVAAGAGACVAKHGNRSVTSKSGSADVLEALGACFDTDPQVVERCLNEVGVTFMFAPKFHLAMKYAIKARQEIGIKTLFNILGPLSNPARASRQVVGVYSEELGEVYAKVMNLLGVKKGIVVHGTDGFDEVSISAPTVVWEIGEGKIVRYTFEPPSLGIGFGDVKEIKGGDADLNGRIMRRVLSGEESTALDMVLVNSAFAIYCSGLAEDLEGGLSLARESIRSGEAMIKLSAFLDYFRR